MTELLITGAKLVTGGDDHDGALPGGRQDILIKDGRYADAAQAGSAATRIDADGLLALPGLIDLHTHLREPGREDAETVESGTEAASRGGFAAVLAMANTVPVTDTAEAASYVRTWARRPATPRSSRSAQSPRGCRARNSPSWG
jgi:dihydroorotase